MSSKSRWLTKELSQIYLQGVRGAIPAAALQFEVIRKITKYWFPRVTSVLDLGCGDGVLGHMFLNEYPEARVCFVDFSSPMLETVQKRMGDSRRARILKADFSSAEWLQSVIDFEPFDIVISGYSIHHQPHYRKRQLYAEIFGILKLPGLFLNLEHVASPTPRIEALFDSFFVDHLHEFHLQSNPEVTRAEIEQSYFNRPDKKENILATVDEQCEWLRQTGFREVDCFLKVFELALLGGMKAASPTPRLPVHSARISSSDG